MNKFALNIFLLIFFNPQFTFSQSDYWTQTNGPHAGTVHDYSFGENDIVYAAADNGVYKSIDNGVTWNSIGFLGTQVWGICKTSSGSLLAGTVDEGLYRTTNEGINWTLVQFIGNYIYDIKEINSNLIMMASYGGIFKSTNNGINWIRTLDISIATSIDTSSKNEIYVTSINSGIYKSTNSGNNWIQLNGTYFGPAFSVNVATNGYIFITTYNGSIYRSTNNGLNFYDIGSPNQIYKTFMSVATRDNYIYVGTFYQGIWSSSDYGETWTKQYPGERTNFFVRKLCEGRNGNVYAAVNHNGVIRTIDHGNLWNGFSFRPSYTRVDFLLKTDDGKILSSTSQTSTDNGLNWIYSDYDFLPTSIAKNETKGFVYATDGSTNGWKVGGIYRSTNNGIDWGFINMENLGSGFYNLHVSGHGDLYVSGGGNMNFGHLNKSTDDGLNWSQISDFGFSVLASNGSDILFGKRSGQYFGIYRSMNSGHDWENVLALNDNSGQIYITNSGDVFAGGNNTLFKSTDNGNSWTKEDISGNVTSIVENQNGRIFVSLYGVGVFMKVGDSWTNLNNNLSNTNVTSLCFNETGQLLAGTTTGVFRTNAYVIGISSISQNIPDQFILSQNYPNPFNPVTQLEFGISNLEFVSLKVYDILGNEVADLVNEKKHPGNYVVEFNGSNLASGIYYYKFIVGSFKQTKKMMLLK